MSSATTSTEPSRAMSSTLRHVLPCALPRRTGRSSALTKRRAEGPNRGLKESSRTEAPRYRALQRDRSPCSAVMTILLKRECATTRAWRGLDDVHSPRIPSALSPASPRDATSSQLSP
eukprot:5494020-Prymnesium_polylepis.1